MNTTFLCIFTLKGVKIFLRANDGLSKQGDMNMRCSCCNSQLNSGRVFKRLAALLRLDELDFWVKGRVSF
ncbi:hypothetical protein, partial [Vibrio sp. 10N.237.312.B06]|uniref:hypothetical protein n=1 Tax=Vibrio sp. 10N.237.312.B06 TaxID=3229974 RepID=UPI003552D1C2